MRDVSQTQCKDAERAERQSTSKSDAKCKDKTREKESHERQPTERRQECLKHESEQYGTTRRVDRSISAHTDLSRGVPADHDAQSQVKKKDSCKREDTRRRPHPKERVYTAKFKKRGNCSPRACQREKVIRTRERK